MSHVTLHGSSLEVTNVSFTHEDLTRAHRNIFKNDARALKEALRNSIPSGTYHELIQLLKQDDSFHF